MEIIFEIHASIRLSATTSRTTPQIWAAHPELGDLATRKHGTRTRASTIAIVLLYPTRRWRLTKHSRVRRQAPQHYSFTYTPRFSGDFGGTCCVWFLYLRLDTCHDSTAVVGRCFVAPRRPSSSPCGAASSLSVSMAGAPPSFLEPLPERNHL